MLLLSLGCCLSMFSLRSRVDSGLTRRRLLIADILSGYQREVLPLAPDWEGSAEATLVRYADGHDRDRAVLYLHGYNDYFFCSEMGERFAAAGWGFYGLDMRKHGRSLRPHQTPCLVTNLSDYYEEIAEAVARIRVRDGVRFVVLAGHSTGGLIAPLYARDCGGVDALFLNSPFLGFRVGRRDELMLRTVVRMLGRVHPTAVVPREADPRYAWSLHCGYEKGGEWSYDERWKRPGDLPLYAGFIRAVSRGHDRVRAGLHLNLPVLVGVSARAGGFGQGFDENWASTDTVLDPQQSFVRSRRIGPRVDRFRVDGALHDLMLSSDHVRAEAWQQLISWMSAL